jgi:hypothetical protein
MKSRIAAYEPLLADALAGLCERAEAVAADASRHDARVDRTLTRHIVNPRVRAR